MIQAYAAESPGAALTPFAYDPGPLAQDQVEIEVESCGICHSDLSMIDNDWGLSSYPLVPGHEVIGRITQRGDAVTHLEVGQCVGIGWNAHSCAACGSCMSGRQHKCSEVGPTIVGRHGGFADRVRCDAVWAVPLPEGIDPATAGPLFCGGLTVFTPFYDLGIRPTDRVGVVGIGGLGHLALQIGRAWGCAVTAFSSSPGKADEARAMGAHDVVSSRDPDSFTALAGTLDLILITVNVGLDWEAYLPLLRPGGRLHFVGAVLEPLKLAPAIMLENDLSVTTSDTGPPASAAVMLEFCARHGITPITEFFPMDRVNDALDHLRRGDARYRLVLTRPRK